MKPRERVRNLLEGTNIDRIPNGLGGCETAGLHNLAYDKLKRVLGVDDQKNRVCTFMNNAVFEPSVLEAMEGDLILLGTRMNPSRFWGEGADAQWKDLHIWGKTLQVANEWEFHQDPDGTWWWGNWAKCVPGALYFDAPAQGPGQLLGELEFPSPKDFNPFYDLPESILKRMQEEAGLLYETTDYSIVCGEMIHDLQLQPGGTVSWWTRMIQEPEACHEFLSKAVDAALVHLKQLHDAVGQYCDILMIANDIGDQRGVTIGPDLWRSIYKPHYQRLFSEWHKITNMKICLHSCGSIIDVLDDLIECGLDVYNPVQISADKMDPVDLKSRFGDRIVFYGGALDATLLPAETPEEVVYEQVRHNIETLGSGGSYIFAGVHNLPGDLPESHFRAMIKAWRDARLIKS